MTLLIMDRRFAKLCKDGGLTRRISRHGDVVYSMKETRVISLTFLYFLLWSMDFILTYKICEPFTHKWQHIADGYKNMPVISQWSSFGQWWGFAIQWWSQWSASDQFLITSGITGDHWRSDEPVISRFDHYQRFQMIHSKYITAPHLLKRLKYHGVGTVLHLTPQFIFAIHSKIAIHWPFWPQNVHSFIIVVHSTCEKIMPPFAFTIQGTR